jgi:tripartite-type tricarboxylate transporter receptor subunit TctC
MQRRVFLSGLACAALTGVGRTALAQEYPVRPIRFIVPYPPAGGTDIVLRSFSEQLGQALGQPIVIDNRGGAAGNVGTEVAARATPDGYTVLFTLSSHTINPKLYGKLPFDVEKDFNAVSLAASVPQILVANLGAPFNTVQEMIAYAKANPGKLNFASVGTGSPAHIAGELLKLKAGIDIVHVPYKGGGPAVADTLGGQVQMAFVSLPAAWQHVKAGRLKAIAVTSAKRTVAAPDVPTLVESGVPECVVDSWYGAFVPAKTPPGAIAKLNAAMHAVLQKPEIKERLLQQGAEAATSTPQDLDARVHDELAKWEYVIRAANIKPE